MEASGRRQVSSPVTIHLKHIEPGSPAVHGLKQSGGRRAPEIPSPAPHLLDVQPPLTFFLRARDLDSAQWV